MALLCPAPSIAQEQPETRMKADVDLVLADAAVKNKSGHVMDELKKDPSSWIRKVLLGVSNEHDKIEDASHDRLLPFPEN